MAEDMIPVRNLQDITECPICQETYTDPRCLPCIHTFCLKCISMWAGDKLPKNVVDCPMCRKGFVIPDNGIRDLPKNTSISKLLAAKSVTAVSFYCNWCQADAVAPVADKRAWFRCVDCRENLCNECNIAHAKIRALHGHHIVGIELKCDDAYMIRMPSMCDKHPDKDLAIYCVDCQETTCNLCFLTQHAKRGHDSADVNVHVMADEFRLLLSVGNSRLRTDGAQQLNSSLIKLQNSRDDVVKKFAEIEGEINAKADQLIATIENQRQQLLGECNEFKAGKLKDVEHQIGEVIKNKATAQSLMNYCEELLEKGSNSDITREAKSLLTRMEEVGNLCNKAKPITVKDEIVTFAPTPADVISRLTNCVGKVQGIYN